jgi:hypothetical protein
LASPITISTSHRLVHKTIVDEEASQGTYAAMRQKHLYPIALILTVGVAGFFALSGIPSALQRPQPAKH